MAAERLTGRKFWAICRRARLPKAYYPSQDRGAGIVVRSALIGAGGRMALGVVQEFVLHKWTSRRHSTQP